MGKVSLLGFIGAPFIAMLAIKPRMALPGRDRCVSRILQNGIQCGACEIKSKVRVYINRQFCYYAKGLGITFEPSKIIHLVCEYLLCYVPKWRVSKVVRKSGSFNHIRKELPRIYAKSTIKFLARIVVVKQALRYPAANLCDFEAMCQSIMEKMMFSHSRNLRNTGKPTKG